MYTERVAMSVCVALVLALSHRAGAQETARIYMSLDGADTNRGTAEAPVATLQKAIQLAERQTAPAEVVIRGGTYFLEAPVTIPRSKKDSRLAIRSADNETAVFDGSQRVDKVEPLEGVPGVYAIKGDFPNDAPPAVWEEATGRHFRKLAGLDSVRRVDCSAVVLDAQTMAIRCRDGMFPLDTDIRMAPRALLHGIRVLRDNVTLRGMEFRNFISGGSSTAVRIGPNMAGVGRNRTGDFTMDTEIDNCRTRNCYFGFHVVGAARTRFTNDWMQNSVTGIWISGVGTVVEHCRMINDRAFRVPWAGTIDQSGIRFYNKPEDAVIRYNLIKNFRAGITSKGSPGTYVIENNTVIGNSLALQIDLGFKVRHNIFSGFGRAFSQDYPMGKDAEVDDNVFWGGRNLAAAIKDPAWGCGDYNVLADPLFAAPQMDDYRLLPRSPALHPGGDRIAGAFPQIPADYQAPPTLRVTAGRRQGAQLPLTLAVKSAAPVRKMRYTINDRTGEEQAFTATVTVPLSNEEEGHTVRVQVQDANGAWSEESVVRVAGAGASSQPSKPPAAPPIAEGRPRMIYVAPDGADAEDAGARDRPFRTMQYALDRAAAGDRVRIKPGVYFGAHRIENRAGTPERPLVIEGLYPNTAILDGLDETGTLLRIEDSPNVIVRNLNLRWYVGQGIVIVNSKGASVTGCRFQNQYWRGGADVEGRPALLFLNCPEFTADHCIFTRTRYQLEFRESPGGQVLHNTFVAGAVTHILWRGAATEGITIKYNSINWNGNQMLNISQPLEVLKHGAVIDGNNYGTTFQKPEGTETPQGTFGKSLPKPFRYLPSNREYLVYQDTTDPAKPTSHAFVNMKDWQEFSGQDKHSIFADPKWSDPKAGRFDVAADSPNLLPDGTVIGALGYLGENPTVPPEVVITAPYSGEEVRGALTITAEASDYDGKIQKVEFYADGKFLGAATTAPYRLEDVKLIPGKHAIAVKAFDDRDATTVSDEVRVIALGR